MVMRFEKQSAEKSEVFFIITCQTGQNKTRRKLLIGQLFVDKQDTEHICTQGVLSVGVLDVNIAVDI